MEISLTGVGACGAWHDVPVLYFQLIVVVAVFGAIAWVAAGRGGGIADTHPDRPEVALPDNRHLGRTDIDAARFAVGWRGYRMDQVDQVLDRLAAEIDVRDRLIAELSAARGGTEPNPYVAFGESGQDAAPGQTLTDAPPRSEGTDPGAQPGGYDPGAQHGGYDPGSQSGGYSDWYRPGDQGGQ